MEIVGDYTEEEYLVAELSDEGATPEGLANARQELDERDRYDATSQDPPTPLTVRELHGRWKRAKAAMAGRGIDQEYGRLAGICLPFLNRSRELRQSLPIQTSVCISPGNTAHAHIACLEPLNVGRLVRRVPQLLCGETRLDGLEAVTGSATCLHCLEIAERLVKR